MRFKINMPAISPHGRNASFICALETFITHRSSPHRLIGDFSRPTLTGGGDLSRITSGLVGFRGLPRWATEDRLWRANHRRCAANAIIRRLPSPRVINAANRRNRAVRAAAASAPLSPTVRTGRRRVHLAAAGRRLSPRQTGGQPRGAVAPCRPPRRASHNWPVSLAGPFPAHKAPLSASGGAACGAARPRHGHR